MRDMFGSSAISLLLCCRVSISIKHALQMDQLHRWNVVISSLMVTPCLWGQLGRLVEARDIMPICPDQRLSEGGQHKDLSGRVTKIYNLRLGGRRYQVMVVNNQSVDTK
ncbi:hypothetical protein EDC04DRAFT_2620605 [Pisolithus marmoratus]|nr:hypothetical protein EDC04DRAFT_2620605 [Pisolithus marmoratus]